MKIVRKDHERMTGDLNYWREEFLADECSEKAADADIATDAPVNCTTYSESKTDSLQGDTYTSSEFTDHDCVVPSSSPCLCSSTGVHACLAECSSYRHAKTVSERWSLLVGRGDSDTLPYNAQKEIVLSTVANRITTLHCTLSILLHTFKSQVLMVTFHKSCSELL